MTDRNETLSRSCRFLHDGHFKELYKAFIEAFSDYVIPFALTEAQFRNHINLNAVDLERTIGCFEGDKLIGFSLNGFGDWNGKSTAYDAGTGVIPGFRRQGISNAMFEMMTPKFKSDGIEQWLLEVITTNTAAISLYEKLGFHKVRELVLLQCDKKVSASIKQPNDITIRDIDEPDWKMLTTFWDGNPSWQNSVPAVIRSLHMKRILGAYLDGKCVGYVVFSSKFGRVAQIAVHEEYRNRGIATALVRAIQSEISEGFSVHIINLDRTMTAAANFFRKLGFYETFSQYEMTMQM